MMYVFGAAVIISQLGFVRADECAALYPTPINVNGSATPLDVCMNVIFGSATSYCDDNGVAYQDTWLNTNCSGDAYSTETVDTDQYTAYCDADACDMAYIVICGEEDSDSGVTGECETESCTSFPFMIGTCNPSAYDSYSNVYCDSANGLTIGGYSDSECESLTYSVAYADLGLGCVTIEGCPDVNSTSHDYCSDDSECGPTDVCAYPYNPDSDNYSYCVPSCLSQNASYCEIEWASDAHCLDDGRCDFERCDSYQSYAINNTCSVSTDICSADYICTAPCSSDDECTSKGTDVCDVDSGKCVSRSCYTDADCDDVDTSNLCEVLDSPWESEYGACPTYAYAPYGLFYGSNAGYCFNDTGITSLFLAKDACTECGECYDENTQLVCDTRYFGSWTCAADTMDQTPQPTMDTTMSPAMDTTTMEPSTDPTMEPTTEEIIVDSSEESIDNNSGAVRHGVVMAAMTGLMWWI